MLYPTWNVQLRPRASMSHRTSRWAVRTVEVTAPDRESAMQAAETRFWPLEVISVSLCSALGPA